MSNTYVMKVSSNGQVSVPVEALRAPQEAMSAVLDVAQLGLADPQPLTATVALRAGLLRARHNHRTTRAVSLADCVAAETARALGAPVATLDPHLLDLCRDEDIGLIARPDSRGTIWSP